MFELLAAGAAKALRHCWQVGDDIVKQPDLEGLAAVAFEEFIVDIINVVVLPQLALN